MVQPMPDHAPIPGTRLVLNPKTGMYDVVGEKATDPEEIARATLLW